MLQRGTRTPGTPVEPLDTTLPNWRQESLSQESPGEAQMVPNDTSWHCLVKDLLFDVHLVNFYSIY